MSFEDYFAELMPPWARGLWLLRFVRAIGRYVDALNAFILIAARMRFIRFDDPIEGALPYHGDNAKLCQYPTESDAAYRSRIGNRWESKRWAGTGKGILDELIALGLSSTETVVADGADGWLYVGTTLTRIDGWSDESYDIYSRFWMVTRNDPWGLTTWDEGDGLTWDDPQLYDTDATQEEFVAIQRIAWNVKSAHAVPIEIAFVHSGDVYDGDATTWDGDSTTWNDGDGEVSKARLSYLWDPPDGIWDDDGIWQGRPAIANC